MALVDIWYRGIEKATAFRCWVFGHHDVTEWEYPLDIHPIPRAYIKCTRCYERLSEETFARARERAASAFQTLMAEDRGDPND